MVIWPPMSLCYSCCTCYYCCCGCHSNVCKRAAIMQSRALKQQNTAYKPHRKGIKSTSRCHFVQITRNKKAKACRWICIYFATVSESKYIAVKRNDRARAKDVYAMGKWLLLIVLVRHILNSWRCTIAYFVYLS